MIAAAAIEKPIPTTSLATFGGEVSISLKTKKPHEFATIAGRTLMIGKVTTKGRLWFATNQPICAKAHMIPLTMP